MPFQLPSLPSFQTNIPQAPSPMEQYGKLLQLKMLQGQEQLQPLQMQQEQQSVQAATLQNQKEQQALASQKALQDAISSGAFNKFAGVETPDGSGFDAAGAYQELVAKHGVLPDQASAAVQSLLKIASDQATMRKTNAQAAEANATVRGKTFDALSQKIGSILDMPAEKAPDALTALKQDLVKNPQAYPGMTQQEMAELYSADLEHLKPVSQLMGLEGKIADFHKSKAAAAKEQQGVIPENGGLSPDTQQQVQKEVAVNTNPEVQAGKVKVAKEEGIARANVEAQIARGSNAALAQVPPHLVAPATEAATKAGQDYAQAKSVSDRLQAMMDAAKNGNVVSYQLLPEEGALQVTTSQGVHRINMAEIQNYGGGSIFQRIEGHLGKQLTGKSIPESVLNDMAEMQKVQQEGAQSKYENSLKTINQAYGSEFKPVQMDDMKAKPTQAPPQGAIRTGVSSLDGKKYYLDANNKKLGLAP